MRKKAAVEEKDTQKESNSKDQTDNKTLTYSIEDNINVFKNIFHENEMLIIRRFANKYLAEAKCCVLYFNGMININTLNENIIEPVLTTNMLENISCDNLLEELQYKILAANNIEMSSDIEAAISAIISGDTLFLVEGYSKILIISTKGFNTRPITEPEPEKVVRGPREGFTEAITVNLTLLRRKIKDTNLKFKFKDIGQRTKTKICICYIEGLVLDDILKELEKRLDDIEIDGILDSGYIQELIRDAPFSPFETVGYSERPDVIAGKILEGRAAVFVDGSPVVLTVPYVMAEGTQANEDYYKNYIFSSINRFIRSSSAIVSTSIPALYLALVTYHQEMLPTPLLLSISASRQGVPIPTSLSLFVMLLIFDILREAGIRMPSAIGQAVNIVGTLVLGEAAVEAKLVSAPVIIITAFSGITTLLNIKMIGATIIVRNFLLLGASVMGVYGFLINFFIVIIHLMNIRSFGVPYLLNITTVKNHNYQDTWIRAPWWSMTLRPKIIAAKNMVRQSNGKNKVKS